MKRHQSSVDLAEFFSFIKDEKQSISRLVESYYEYHGLLNFGHRTLMVEAVKSRLQASGAIGADKITHFDVIGQNGELKAEFISKWCDDVACPYFAVADTSSAVKKCILRESRNEWQSDRLPSPYNTRLSLLVRPALDLYQTRGGELFVSTHGYQYFERGPACFWPAASSRAFGASILKYPAINIDSSVVIIQDKFDASNFAHFLYDYIPRIIYFCETATEHLPSLRFLIGGIKGPFQSLLIDELCDHYGLHQRQFIFDPPREIWDVAGNVYFFSDQSVQATHPLNVCHPETLRLVRSILSKLPLTKMEPNDIYVSRRDATTRRIANELDVVAALKEFGYSCITMSDYDPVAQISLLANARSIVAPHGMGLTNVFFNRRVSSVLELFCPLKGSDDYALVCASGGIEYDFDVGTSVNDSRDLSFNVDIQKVRQYAARKQS